MRMVFGVLMLLVVLAVVSTVGRRQFEALGSVSTRVRALVPGTPAPSGGGPRDSSIVSVPGGMPGAAPAGVEGGVPYQARQVGENVFDAQSRALQQSVDRYKRAEP